MTLGRERQRQLRPCPHQLWGRKGIGRAVQAQGQVRGLKEKKVFFYTAGTGFLVLSYPAFLREDSLAEMMVLVNVAGGLGDQKLSYNFLIEQNAGRAGKRKNDLLMFRKLLWSKEAAGLSNSVIGRKFSRLF